MGEWVVMMVVVVVMVMMVVMVMVVMVVVTDVVLVPVYDEHALRWCQLHRRRGVMVEGMVVSESD